MQPVAPLDILRRLGFRNIEGEIVLASGGINDNRTTA